MLFLSWNKPTRFEIRNSSGQPRVFLRSPLTRAARCDNATREPLCFAAVSFFSFLSFFIQREISTVSRPIAAKLCHMIGNGRNLKTRSKIWGPPSKKNWGRKTCFLARFLTTSHFDREYLRNGTRYWQSEKGVANYGLSRWLNRWTLVHKRRKTGP